MNERFLLVGLGNPGARYADTRHNMGFKVVDEIAEKSGLLFRRDDESYLSTKSEYQQNDLILIKPLTYMNLSGIAVSAALKHYEIETSHILIVHDDLSLPFGKLRMRAKGSDGGNKGLASIIQYLQTEKIPRLKIGIGSPDNREETVDYVLSHFHDEEKKHIQTMIQRSVDACFSFIDYGISETMNTFN